MKQENLYNSTALVDADYILWIACNKNKVYDKSGVALRDEGGRLIYTDKTLEEAISTCDSYINDLFRACRADSYIMFLTAYNNFRYGLDPAYKANRTGVEKPMWINEVREHMKIVWGAIEVPGLEADDLVVITLNNLTNSFIVAADKDVLDCTPGRHFDVRKGRVGFITTTTDYADYAFARSVLTGDAIDGISNMKSGYGIKTAEKDLNHLINKQDGDVAMTALNAASLIYQKHLGVHDGIIKFAKQYQMLKILDSFYQIPEGINYQIPEPTCFNCTETILTREIEALGVDYLSIEN